MSDKTRIAAETQSTWLIFVPLCLAALISALSGVYFLFLPNGYQGGRNPRYGVTLIFDRYTWRDVHIWAGCATILITVFHVVIHWHWIVRMTKRMFGEFVGRYGAMNRPSRVNLMVNIMLGLSFLAAAVSGVYFLFVQPGWRTPDPSFLMSKNAWDILHTWAGTVLVIAAVVHLSIHWKWVLKVTHKMIKRHTTRVAQRRVPEETVTPV